MSTGAVEKSAPGARGKKLGLPDYGSLGASCHVEVELDGLLLQSDVEAFHNHVRNTFTACRQAAQDELTRHQAEGAQPMRSQPPISEGARPMRTPDSNQLSSNGHAATEKQLNFVNQLAQQTKGVGVRRVEQLAAQVCNKPLAELTSLDASALIDTLKAIKAGDIDVAPQGKTARRPASGSAPRRS